MPNASDFYSNFQKRSTENGWGDLPKWSDIGERRRDQIGLVLSRLAVAHALHTDDPISEFDREAGMYEGTALRLYLYLTCLEMLGRLARGSKYYQYSNWLKKKRNEPKEQREEACVNALRDEGNSISSTESLVKALIAVHDTYNTQHGCLTHFRAFFTECLDQELIKAIVEQCWVFEKCPDVIYGGLHMVQPGYTSEKSESPALKRLADGRAKWDSLKLEDRVTKIAKVLADVRNDYTHGLSPTFVPLDKKPWTITEDAKIARSVVSGKVRYLRDRKFKKLHLRTGKRGTWNGVQAIAHDGVFYVRKSDLAGTTRQSWLADVVAHCCHPVDMGDAIYLPRHKVALATSDMPLTQHLERWIHNGLKNTILLNHNQAQS